MSEQEDKKVTEQEAGSSKGNLLELYEKMSKSLREKVDKAGSLSDEVFERALNESRDLANKMKEHYNEDISKVSDFIRRDWHEAIRQTTKQTKKSLDLDRIQVGIMGVLSRVAKSAGSQLEGFASKLNEKLTYKTGEIAGTGTLKCQKCKQLLNFEKPTRIPPCPKCRETVFRRSY